MILNLSLNPLEIGSNCNSFRYLSKITKKANVSIPLKSGLIVIMGELFVGTLAGMVSIPLKSGLIVIHIELRK